MTQTYLFVVSGDGGAAQVAFPPLMPFFFWTFFVMTVPLLWQWGQTMYLLRMPSLIGFAHRGEDVSGLCDHVRTFREKGCFHVCCLKTVIVT